MESTGWIITLFGGVIVGVIVLVVEYGYFKKRKERSQALTTSHSNKEISQTWNAAVEIVLQTFSQNHPNSRFEIIEMKLGRGFLGTKGLLCVKIIKPNNADFQYLKIDRTGDILAVSSKKYDIFPL